MSLFTLPEGKYHYLSIDKLEGDGWSGMRWSAGDNGEDNAQFWIDKELNESEYTPYIWWKFWKKVDTFEIRAYNSIGKNVYETIKLHRK